MKPRFWEKKFWWKDTSKKDYIPKLPEIIDYTDTIKIEPAPFFGINASDYEMWKGTKHYSSAVTLNEDTIRNAFKDLMGEGYYEEMQEIMTEQEYNKLAVVAFGRNGVSSYAFSKDNKYLYVLTTDDKPEFPVHLYYDKESSFRIPLLKKHYQKSTSIYRFTAIGNEVKIEAPVKKTGWGFD